MLVRSWTMDRLTRAGCTDGMTDQAILVTGGTGTTALPVDGVVEPSLDAGDGAGLLVDLVTEVLDGRNARPTDGVREVLGRDATDFADVVRAGAPALGGARGA